MHKMRFLLRLTAFWCFLSNLTLALGYFVDYTENTELIQQRAGLDVKLQCDLKGLVDERKLDEIKIHWYFKQCSDNCHQFDSPEDWTALPCEQSLCRSELWLRNITDRYSGLYKCTINPHVWDPTQTADIQLVRTYQLDVKNTSLAAPEFLDAYPLNHTAAVESQVVFQCRVHSAEHPTIKWFHRLNYAGSATGETLPPSIGNGNGNFSTRIVRYNGRTYELLATAPEKLIGTQIYLSKFIINGVRLRDEGFYACVAITYHGHKIREAYLEVLPNAPETEYWSDYNTSDEGDPSSDPREFWLLFLMPLGLALLPLSVWCGYLLYRRFRTPHECERMHQQYSDEEMDTERCVLGGN
ncbi:uncharacterized protein LOC115621235 [Scaptodrosophila lebanonensis]|uniref:receptor protein-tyrosine kinase n=1 Tax=Drosophila lebanonensis TaxID=7225 RepID=A0A6J2T5Y7_DROLE|nr:uncharacterized protein LOC115621235 [Scaptodrosophila lebanonensis]